MSLRDKHKTRDEAFQKLAVKLAMEARKMPSDFGLNDDRLFYTHGNAPVGGRHRDSDVLDNSNHEVILKALREQFPEQDGVETVEVGRYGHWAVGWCETIVVPLFRSGIWCKECGWHHWDERDGYNPAAEKHFRDFGGEHTSAKACDYDTLQFEMLSEPWLACVEWYLALQDYPIADEDAFSEAEATAEVESWDSYGRSEFERKLKRMFPEHDEFIDEVEAEILHDVWKGHLDQGNSHSESSGFYFAFDYEMKGLTFEQFSAWVAEARSRQSAKQAAPSTPV